MAGAGPGVIAPDGCAVEVYLALPVGAEPDLIDAVIPSGSTILELGAGVGRVTHELLSRGHSVTAVDDCAEMLAQVRGAETVVVPIEELHLGRTFDAVLLCSHLINTADAAQREAFLATCARHVAPGGVVIIERHAPLWFDTVAEGEARLAHLEIRLRNLARPEPNQVAATVEYSDSTRVWTQSFVAERVSDRALADSLGRSGLAVESYLDEKKEWVLAVPMKGKLER